MGEGGLGDTGVLGETGDDAAAGPGLTEEAGYSRERRQDWVEQGWENLGALWGGFSFKRAHRGLGQGSCRGKVVLQVRDGWGTERKNGFLEERRKQCARVERCHTFRQGLIKHAERMGGRGRYICLVVPASGEQILCDPPSPRYLR